MSGNPEQPSARAQGTPVSHVRGADRLASPGLFDIIHRQIIPRLMHTHQVRQRITTDQDAWRQRRCAELAELSISSDERAAFHMAQQMLVGGMTLDTLLFEMIPETASLLGQQWEEDTKDFTEVTVGLWRLHLVIRELSPRQLPSGTDAASEPPPSILLAPAPGEQHTLGLLLVAECFQRDNWVVHDLAVSTRQSLLQQVTETQFSAIGLSVGVPDHLAAIAVLVNELRETSYNPDLLIMLGGQGLGGDDGMKARLGVDLICHSPQDAPRQAAKLIGRNMTIEPSQPPSDRGLS